MKKILYAIFMASKNDESWVNGCKTFEMLDEVLPEQWLLVNASADRDGEVIRVCCGRLVELGVLVVTFCAGLHPVIGRVGAAAFKGTLTTTMCVPEERSEVTSMLWAPEGIALTCPGWGKRGVFNGSVDACKRLGLIDRGVASRLDDYLGKLNAGKQPQFDIRGALKEKE